MLTFRQNHQQPFVDTKVIVIFKSPLPLKTTNQLNTQ
jgi:hypothetical protein